MAAVKDVYQVKSAVARAEWARLCEALVIVHTHYAISKGDVPTRIPNFNHITQACAAEGFNPITDANYSDAIKAVVARAEAAASGQPSTPAPDNDMGAGDYHAEQDAPPDAPQPPATPPAPKQATTTPPATQRPVAATVAPSSASYTAPEPSASRALAPYGSRAEVREFFDRLSMMTLPGGKKLETEERRALAQASLAHGLDPFNGEIWILPSGIMIGIKGLRKLARKQLNGNFWVDFHEITDPDIRKRMGIPDSALAYEARLFDSETILNYSFSVAKFLEAGIPWDAVRVMLGEKPYAVGIGYARPGEPSKMTTPALAMKRAESEVIKRRFDVPFDVAQDADPEPVNVTPGPSWDVEGDKQALWGEQDN